jgi:HEAT repeat protein
VLGAAMLDVRGSAALALARLGDPSGAAVLQELLEPESYAAEHAVDADRWYRAEHVSESRIQAVQALARLGRPADLAVLAAAEAREDDQNVLAEIKGALREARTE